MTNTPAYYGTALITTVIFYNKGLGKSNYLEINSKEWRQAKGLLHKTF
jgi:hypothetical protein